MILRQVIVCAGLIFKNFSERLLRSIPVKRFDRDTARACCLLRLTLWGRLASSFAAPRFLEKTFAWYAPRLFWLHFHICFRALQLTHAVLRLAKTSRLKMLKMGRRPSSRSIWKFFRCVVIFDFLFGNLLRHLMYGLKSRYIVDSLRHLASSLVPSLHSL